MEILIDVPAYLQPVIAYLYAFFRLLQTAWHRVVTDSFHLLSSSVEKLLHIPRNILIPLSVVIFLFWPVIITLIMAFATAWTWIFWLITSVILGIFQLGYVTYQFIMIACDIFGLSILKTYSMLRSYILFYLDKSGSLHKSQRRLWRQRLDEAGSYENFLKIPILEKSVESADTKNGAKLSGKPSSPSSRYLPKVRSFGRFTDADMDNDKTMNDNSRGSPIAGNRFLRTRSFSGTSTSNSTAGAGRGSSPSSPCSLSLAHALDLVVVEELGERTADLLLTTTARLKEARLAAQESQRDEQEEGKQEQLSTGRGEVGDGSRKRTKQSDTSHKTEEAANALKYLLVGVVKRNHLALDDILVENARSIAESGRHGLSLASRKLIRCYYEEVERGLDWIAESPPVPHNHNHTNNSSSSNAATAPTSTNTEGEAEKNAHHENELWDRITLVRRMKQNMGRTALMLSGGGAIAMYHLGVIRALIESGLYDDIKVISGTSGKRQI